jgi:hypothetical protein
MQISYLDINIYNRSAKKNKFYNGFGGNSVYNGFGGNSVEFHTSLIEQVV